MSNYKEDPRLTAFALGELEGKDLIEIEELLENSPEARAEVESIRALTVRLESALSGESEGLTAKQREEVLVTQGKRQPGRGRRILFWGLGTAAAIVLVAWVSVPTLMRSRIAANERSGPPEFMFTRKTLSTESQIRLYGDVDAHADKWEATPWSVAGNLSRESAQTENSQLITQRAETETKYSNEVLQELSELQNHQRAFTNKLQVLEKQGDKVGAEELKVRIANLQQQQEIIQQQAQQIRDTVDLEETGGEEYLHVPENPFQTSFNEPLSTFSIDVDTASYANVRRYLTGGNLPPVDAVRIEEMVNYFTYEYPVPDLTKPFSAHVEVATCPWEPEHRLARIGLQGQTIAKEDLPPSNLVFLLDVSGSMSSANKLELVKTGMKMLVQELGENDRVAIVVYAGAAGIVLPSTNCLEQKAIIDALDRLHAGGSTAGAAGIQLAYSVAMDNFIEGGTNRVILCTDGDFNVGVSDHDALVKLAEAKAKNGVFLSVLGFGMGNIKDGTLEQIANHGNGNYAYIDSEMEAKKVLVKEMGGTLITIAKDVKIQIEFNPAEVEAYRLIGYENRMLAAQDFNDDTKDAGEIGSGHRVTALYEIVPRGGEVTAEDLKDGFQLPGEGVDPLKYLDEDGMTPFAQSGEMMTVKLRYKEPDGETSKLLQFPAFDNGKKLEDSSKDFRFASSVAGFGMMLRHSKYKGQANWDLIEELATEGGSDDRTGYRAEFVGLVKSAAALQKPEEEK